MANSTFKGPIRAENGFAQITLNSYGEATTNLEIDSVGNIETTGDLTVGGDVTITGQSNHRVAVNSSTYNVAGAISQSVTAAQSGTLFAINGAANKVITMPTVSTGNVGVTYDFIVTTAVAAGATVTFVLPGAGVSDWLGQLQLAAGTASNPASDVAGDTITLANSTLVNARIRVTCITDDGTNSTWKAETLSSPIATIA